MLKTNCPKVAKNLFILPILTLFFVALTTGSVLALTSETVNFQGKIVRNDTGHEGLNVIPGTPACVVDGAGNDTCDFRVLYYTASTGGTLLLTEDYTNVEIGQYDGVFELSLGAGSVTTSAVCRDGTCNSLVEVLSEYNDVYVELRFAPDGTTLTETFARMPLEASAYSIFSKYAEGAKDAFKFSTSISTNTQNNPVAGMVYFDTNDSELKVYDGTAWGGIGGGSLWTDSGTMTYLTSVSDDLVLGADTIADATFFFDVDGLSGSYFEIDDATNTNRLFTVLNSGNVGIGTATPGAKLEIGGTTSTLSNSSGDITIDPAQYLNITSRVGIGTATPGYMLDVSDGTGIVGRFSGRVVGANAVNNDEFVTLGQVQSSIVSYWSYTAPNLTPSNANTNVLPYANGDGSLGSSTVRWNYVYANYGDFTNSVTTPLVVGGSTATSTLELRSTTGVGTTSSIKFTVGSNGGTEAMRIINNGNVGIGTSNPGAKLEIGGASSTIANSTGNIVITPAQYLQVNSRLGVGIASPLGQIHSYTSNAAVTTAQYSGYFENLATNTTTDGINKYGIYITSTGAFAGLTGTATNNYGLYVETPTGGDNNYAAIFAGGNVGIGTASPTSVLEVNGGVELTNLYDTAAATGDNFFDLTGCGTTATVTAIDSTGAVTCSAITGFLTSEADTLATVTGRGASTTVASSFTGGATVRGLIVDHATTTYDRILTTVAAVGVARYDGTITNVDLTAARTWTMQDNSGVVALGTAANSLFFTTTGATNVTLPTTGTLATTSQLVTTFTGLTDTPSAYTGQGGKLVAVNAGGTALEFITASTFTDTNDYVDSVTFNTTDGVLTLGRTGVLSDLTADLDGRYLTSFTEADTLATVTGRGASTTVASTFSTSITSPLIIGGTAADSSLDLRSTSGTGTTSFIKFSVGTNGGVEAMRILNDGKVGIGEVAPTSALEVNGGVELTNLYDTAAATGDNFFDLTGCGTTATVTAIDSTGAVTCSAITGFLTSEADTLATVTGRGASTTVASSFTGGATVRGLIVDHATTTYDRILTTVAAVGVARYDGTITNVDLTAARTWTMQDNSGVVALGTAANSLFFTTTGATNVTLPTTGTLATTSQIPTTYWSKASTDVYPTTSGDNVRPNGTATLGTSSYRWSTIYGLNADLASTSTTTNVLNVVGNSLTTGILANFSSASTAGVASSTSVVLNIARSGINSNLAHTAYGIYTTVTNTNATSGTNVAAYLSASGATTANYGLIVGAGSVGIGTVAPTQLLDVNGATRLRGLLYDYNNESGTTGQILSRSASGVDWIDAPTGGSTLWDEIGDPGTDSSVINFGSYHTNLTFNTLAANSGFTFSSTSISGLASATTKIVDILSSGSNTNSGITRYGISSSITNTGTTSINIAGYFNATGASTNYGLLVENGNVGIGTITPTNKLVVNSTAYSTIELQYSGTSVVDIFSNASSNIFIGLDSGSALTSGTGNISYGFNTLKYNTTGTNNTAIGHQALVSNVAKEGSTAIGYQAMLYADSSSVAGLTYNTAIGYQALVGSATAANNTGVANTAVGHQSLTGNTSGGYNTALGVNTLNANTTGTQNVAIGHNALFSNVAKQGSVAIGYEAMRYADSTITGALTKNVAIGYQALYGSTITANNTGTGNTAMGYQTLYSNTSGYSNIAIGDSALKLNTAGGNNVALGYTSLTDNTSGDGNVAIGRNSLANNTTADYNVAIGDDVLSANTEGFWNIALGSNTMNYTSTAYGNIAMGRNALQGSPTFINNTGSNNIALGQDSINDNGSGSNNIGIGYGTLFTNQAKAGSIAIGYEAMYYADNTVTAGSSYNTAIGYQALKGSTTAGNNTGTGNTVLGYQSGTAITSGSNNTVVGFGAGDSITSSPSNTLIGYLAGQNLTTGSGFNIIIGSGVDAINATGTQQLNIGNTIFGDLSTDSISIGNATLTAGTMFAVGATSQFQVDSNGDIIKLKNLTYSWPSTHATGALINNGSGTLSWQNVPTAAGTATPGQVTFWNGTNSITGNNNFWWDNANVRLGIGTNTPTATLDIGGASSRIANASGDITIDPAGNLIIASGSNVGIGTTTPQAILDVAGVTSEIANSSGDLTINPAGNLIVSTGSSLGIGVSPTKILDVAGAGGTSYQVAVMRLSSSSVGGISFATVADNDAQIGAGMEWNGTAWVARDTSAQMMRMINGGYNWYADTGLTSGNTFTPTSRMTLSTTGLTVLGNMQISAADPELVFNETSPAVIWRYKISGDQWILSRDGLGDRMVVNNAGSLIIKGTLFNNEDATVDIGASAASSTLRLFSSNSVHMQLTSAGNIETRGAFEINSLLSGNRYAYMDFHGDDTYTDYGLRIIRENTGANATTGFYHRGTGTFLFSATEAAAIAFNSAGSARMTIDGSGNIGMGTTSMNTRLNVTSTDSNGGIYLASSGGWMRYAAGSMGAGAYNPLTKAGDNAIIFSNGTAGAGELLIAGWSSSATGLRIRAASTNVIIQRSVANNTDANTYLEGLGAYHSTQGVDSTIFYEYYTDSTNVARVLSRTGTALDLAEWYHVGGKSLNSSNISTLKKGDLVCADHIESEKVVTCGEDNQEIIGVVSTKPYTTMGENAINADRSQSAEIALVGRIPLIVTSKNGDIRIGDPITVSNLNGVGQKATGKGQIVGTSMEDFIPSSCPSVSSLEAIVWPFDDGHNESKPCFVLPDGTYVGKVVLFLNISWYDPFVEAIANQNGVITESGWYRIAELNGPDDYAKVKINNTSFGSSQNLALLVDTVGGNSNVDIASNFTSGDYNFSKARVNTVGNIKYLEIYIGSVNNNNVKVNIENEISNWKSVAITKVGDVVYDTEEYVYSGVLFGVSDVLGVTDSGVNIGGDLIATAGSGNIGDSVNRWNDIYARGVIRIGSSNGEGAIRFNVEKQVLELSNDGTTWVSLGDLGSQMVISPEYPGAILFADGSDNLGAMTSDAEESTGSFRNYYEWVSNKESLQDYDILVRITLPSDFVGWKENAISLDLMTENSASVNNNKINFTLMGKNGIDAEVKDGISTLPGAWERISISSTDITDCNNAGDTCTLRISMSSTMDYFVRVGDITLNYNRGL